MSFLFLSLLVACGTEDQPQDHEKKETEPATLVVTSPEDGATFDFGAPVPLSVTATRGGQDVEVSRVTWTIGTWTANGATAEARDLDAGTYTVAVQADVDGQTLTGSVGIEVLEPEVPAEPVPYSGSMQAQVLVHTADYGDFEDQCNGPVSFVVRPDGTVAGQGNCTAFDQDFVFAMEGQVANGVTQGQLILSYDGQDYGTPWDGTGDVGGPLAADFDKTHSSGRDSIRIYGNWSATPQ